MAQNGVIQNQRKDQLLKRSCSGFFIEPEIRHSNGRGLKLSDFQLLGLFLGRHFRTGTTNLYVTRGGKLCHMACGEVGEGSVVNLRPKCL